MGDALAFVTHPLTFRDAMDFLKILLWFLTGLLFIGSLIPFLKEQIWWLRAWTYARLQKFWSAVILCVVYAVLFGLRDWADIAVYAVLLLIAAICLRDILPFTALGRKQVVKPQESHQRSDIKLFVGNVLMENHESEKLLEQIADLDPDIIFLVETNERWKGYMEEVERKYPYNWLLPLEDFNGMLLYSKFPLNDINERRLVQDHIPSVRMNIEPEGSKAFTFYGLHPRPPRPEDDTADLDKELTIVAEEICEKSGPVIITGDLNDVGWSTTTKHFLNISGLKDPRRGRGLFNTFNAKNPLVRWPLDHVFISEHFDLIEMRRLEAFGSDHFPIFIHLSLDET